MKVKQIFKESYTTLEELKTKLKKMEDNSKKRWSAKEISYIEKRNLENLRKRIGKLRIEIEIREREKN
jgi:hypothetical protein